MRPLKKLPVFLFILLYIEATAKNITIFYNDTAIIVKQTIFEDEKQAVTDAITKYLDAAGIRIADLNVSNTNTGGKLASGKVSFFGFDNIELKAELNNENKVHSITTIFPGAVSITPEKLVKFLSGRQLISFLPKSFPLTTNLSLKELSVEFDNSSDVLSKVGINFGIGSYAIEGFDGFTVTNTDINFILDKPATAEEKATATVSGDGNIGSIPIILSANMSTKPEDLLFTFSVRGVSISSVVNSFMSESRSNSLLNLIPGFFKTKQIDNLTASFNPTNKNFTGLAQTSFGEAEIQFTGATDESKSTILFGIAPPAGFKFSNISGSLQPMDNIGLSNTALIISTLQDPDAKSSLAALNGEGEIKLEQGVNIFSTISLNQDLSNFLKKPSIKLKGTVNESFTGMSLQAALNLGLKLSENVTMQDVLFGLRLGTIHPVEFMMGGLMEANVGGDLLGFNVNFIFSPTDQKIGGEFYMMALQKMNNPKVISQPGADAPEWTNPFGIPGVGLQRLGASVGVDFKNPILLSSLGITGSARFGLVNDRSKHLYGDVTVVIDITNPTKSLIDIKVKNLTPLKIIEAYKENAGINEPFRTMLSSGFDSAHLLVVPVDGVVAFGKTYNKGIGFGGVVSLGGLKGYADFNLNDGGVSGFGAIDPVNWGDVFRLSGRTTDRPQFRFSFLKDARPNLFIDGKISLLGISSETTVNVDDKGFDFTTAGKLFSDFELTLEAKGKSFTQNDGGIYIRAAMRNDLIAKLNQFIIAKLDVAVADTKKTLQGTRDKLNNAINELDKKDIEIAAKRAEVTTRRNADLQKMRDEAQRALDEKKAVIGWHKKNNEISYKRINELRDEIPWELAEKGALYIAIGLNDLAIQAEQAAYDGYAETVKGLADIGSVFPKETDPGLLALISQRAGLQITYDVALLGVDIAEGVSVTALEATKFIMDQALGGVFDIKSAEFEGTFGLNNNYKINVAFNVTLAKKPYNFSAEIDFKDIEGSAKKVAIDIFSGNLLKPGFVKTFATELKAAKNYTFTSTPVVLTDVVRLSENARNKVMYSYEVTLETTADADAGSKEKFAIIITGNNGATEQLALTKDLYSIQPGQKVAFTVKSEKYVGPITKVQLTPLNSSMTDNLKIKSISVEMPAEKINVHEDCEGCVIAAGQTAKTIAFDGKKYADYWVTISTNMGPNSGTDGRVSLKFKGANGEHEIHDMKKYFPASIFKTGYIAQVPISIPDIGSLQSLTINGGNVFDNWNIGGVIVKDANGTVSSGYCNCVLSGNNPVTFYLAPPTYFADYKITIKTANKPLSFGSIDGSGTDANEYITLIGDKGQIQKINLGNIMTTKPGVFGLQNLFEAGTTNYGYITARDIGAIQKIIIEHSLPTIIEDKWDIESLVIESYSKGNRNTTILKDLNIDKESSGKQIPVVPTIEKTNPTQPVVNTPVQNTIPVTDLANKTVSIQNFWKKTESINEESGVINSSAVGAGALTAQWIIKPLPGTNYFWIENSNKTGHRINVETGTIASSVIQDGAWSAHWIIKKNGNGTYWIENRWKAGERLNVEKGKLECSKVQDGAWSAMWNLNAGTAPSTNTNPIVPPTNQQPVTTNPTQPVVNTPTQNTTPINNVTDLANKTVSIQNFWKKTESINEEGGVINSSAVGAGALTAQWIIKPVPGTNYFWIENSNKTGHRINVETGTIASSVIQDGAWSAHWRIKKNGNGTYWIESRWKAGERLNVEKGKLECSKVQDGAWSAMWNLNAGTAPSTNTNPIVPPTNQQPVTTNPTQPLVNAPVQNTTPVSNVTDLANKTVSIQNFWKTAERINEEGGFISSSAIGAGALTAQWIIKPVPGTNYFWIENNNKTGHRINVETGAVASSVIQDGAWSAHWIIKKNGNGAYWIESRWKAGERLNVEKGKLECSKVQDGAWSAMWNLNAGTAPSTNTNPIVSPTNQQPVTTNPTQPVVNTQIQNTTPITDLANKTVSIQNFWKTAERINEEGGVINSSAVGAGTLTAQWIIKPVPGTNYFWIENSNKTGHRINVETGAVASSVIQDGAWSAHWVIKKNGNGTYWIESRWKTGERLNVEKGKLECSKVQDGAWSAMWNLK